VVLGADTRATNDTVVADKNCEKIHFIAENIYCCGAGTAADTENTTGAYRTHMRPLVAAGAHSRPRNVLTVMGVLVVLSFASFLG
jgi:20S proteasome subunit beta 2